MQPGSEGFILPDKSRCWKQSRNNEDSSTRAVAGFLLCQWKLKGRGREYFMSNLLLTFWNKKKITRNVVENTMKDHIRTVKATQCSALGHKWKSSAGKKENTAKFGYNVPVSKSTTQNVCFKYCVVSWGVHAALQGYAHFFSARQWSMHMHRSCKTNAALLLQGLWMCPGHKISDSCFIFDVLTMILPVLRLHHKNGGYSLPLHSLLLLGSTSQHHHPQMEIWALSWEEETQLRDTSEAFLSPWLKHRTHHISQQLLFDKRKPQTYRHSPSLRDLPHLTHAWAAARDVLSEQWLLLGQPLFGSQNLLEPYYQVSKQ